MKIFKFVLTSLMAVFILSSGLICAQSSNNGVAQGYKTNDELLKPGMFVQYADSSEKDSQLVERSSSDKQERLLGVAVSPTDSFAVVGSSDFKVYVQTSGEAEAFVSDINGQVKKGDDLVLSPLRGILMKYDITQSRKVARALEDPIDQGTEEIEVNQSSGNASSRIQKVKISILSINAANDQGRNSALARLSKSVSGKDVGDLRVIIAIVIFTFLIVIEGGIIYSAVSSSLIAIGRNPLSKGAIRQELIKVLLIALIVLFSGLTAVYLLLRA